MNTNDIINREDFLEENLNNRDTYRANPLLKRAHVDIDWTPELVKEYIKCSKDIVYFIRTYCKIISLDEGLVNFDLYDFQEDIATTIVDNRFTIIKTPRQAGKTTTAAAVILHHVLFQEQYTVGILANKLTTAREILGRVQRGYENLPSWLQQGVFNWSKTSIELENGSQVIAASTSSSAIRGFSINFLYLDEFAFVPRNVQEEFFTSVYPTIVSGKRTKVVITSTPNGFDLFYKLWMNSVEKKNEYANISVHWSDVPGRDDEWRVKTIANTSEEQFRQEFEAEFIGSMHTLLSPSTLKRLVWINPIHTRLENTLKIYKEPVLDHHYFCTVDTARGVGIDASAFLVFDLTTYPYEVVAAYADNTVDPLLYPEIIYEVAKRYNNCYTLIEINDNGQQIADILSMDLEYENLVYTANKGRNGQQINGGFGGGSTQKGVRTTAQLKRIGCANIRTMIENDKLLLNDFELIREFSTFVMKSASFAAEEGSHDDLVMCCVLLAWATNQEFFKNLTNTNFRQKLLDEKNEHDDAHDLLPFGIIDDGSDEIYEEETDRMNPNPFLYINDNVQW
tara:strand:- start:10852 stop:12549 length:1698 start_codon:yes stop_codon:yes gene_type:complete